MQAGVKSVNSVNGINGIKRSRSRKRGKLKRVGVGIKNFLLVVFILLFATVIFFLLMNSYFFRVRDVSISENDKYTYDEILQASGIVLGDELFGINVKKIKENLRGMLTYAETVNVKQIPPSTVSIDIKTEKGFFGIILGGDYYIISKSFKVIDKIKIAGSGIDESEFRPPEGIITFETDTVIKCYVGEKIEFSDKDISDFLKSISEMFEEENYYEMLSVIIGVNIKNKFKVEMNYSDKFLVRFGIFENIASKILKSFEIINQLPDYAEGVIDMTSSGNLMSFNYDESVSELYKSNK